jgi:hypothetical protein
MSLLFDPAGALAHQHIRDLTDQARRHQLASTPRAENPQRAAWLAAAWVRLRNHASRTDAVSNHAVCCA